MIEKNEDTGVYRHIREQLVTAQELLDFDDARSSCRFSFPERTSTRLRLAILAKLLGHIELESGPLYGFSSSNYPDKKWEKFFSYLTRTGIVRGIEEQHSFNDELPLADVHLQVNIDRIVTDGHRSFLGFNRGTALTYDEALSKACGEFLERYSLYTYRQKDLVRASIRDLAHKAHLDPGSVASFAVAKRVDDHLLAFDETSVFYWVEGTRLSDGRATLIPAQLIYWNYCTHHKRGLEPYIREPNTNGAAGGFTLQEAILSGLLELIQRDGFLLYWYNKAAPPQIDQTSIEDTATKELLRNVTRFNYKVVLLDTTTEFNVPSCACVLLDESGAGPTLAVGGGCDPDPVKAIERSLIEACSIHRWLRKKKFSVPFDPTEPPFSSKYIGQTERSKIWAEPRMRSEFDFFLNGNTEPFSEFARNASPNKDVQEQLSALTKTLSNFGSGYEPYYVAAHNDILDDAGYHAVKVVVPELIPLHLNEWNAATGARRIREGFERLGRTPAETLNPLPHPFP